MHTPIRALTNSEKGGKQASGSLPSLNSFKTPIHHHYIIDWLPMIVSLCAILYTGQAVLACGYDTLGGGWVGWGERECDMYLAASLLSPQDDWVESPVSMGEEPSLLGLRPEPPSPSPASPGRLVELSRSAMNWMLWFRLSSLSYKIVHMTVRALPQDYTANCQVTYNSTLCWQKWNCQL